MLKSFKNVLFYLLLMFLVFVSCSNAEIIEVISISLDKSSLNLHIGDVEAIIATVLPENATNKKLNYISSNIDIAEVDNQGKVRAKSIGAADIMVNAKGGAFAVCRLNVIPFYVEGITLNKSSLYLDVGEKETLIATITPENATDKTIIYNSSNTDVATVSQSGEIYAKAIGNSKITATTEDGNFVATCDVNVVIKAASLSLNKSSLVMEVGDEETLIPNITPSDATNKSVTWQSSNPEIAAVDENGKVTGVSFGEADIICKTVQSDITAICNVKVEQTQVTGIQLNKNLIEMEVGDEETLTATITPSNSTNKSIIWVIDDENIATIDNTGKIVAKSLGETIVTATTKDGDFSAICHVKVVIKVKNISLNKNSLRLEVGGTETLIASIMPENATNANIIWNSSDESIATVDDKGQIKGKSAGNTIITAKTEDGDFSAICDVEVIEYPCLKFESSAKFSITSTKNGDATKTWNGKLYYTTDRESGVWMEWNGSKISSAINGGRHSIFIRGFGNTCITGKYISGYQQWEFDGNSISCTGDIRSLLNCFDVENTTMDDYCFASMFYNCKSLTTAPELPATTLASSCYSCMFFGCTSLTTAPELPATTLAASCYGSMFLGCKSLTTAPELPATTLADSCYSSMFCNCTSLKTAPELPATTLAVNCYAYMLRSCTSLKAAPELPATTLASSCYSYMFYDCTSLTTAPILPVTTLAASCYRRMFFGCTSLKTAPELPATTLADSCYSGMFSGCTSLTTAPELPATTLAYSCYYGMFSGCTSLTTAPELPATTLADDCYSYMLDSCKSLTTAPALPAETLAVSCYESMFKGCTSLVIVPALPAETLAGSCYRNMFFGCTSLTAVPALAATTLPSNCYSNMFDGCKLLKFSETRDELNGYVNEFELGIGVMGSMFSNTGGTFTGTPKSGQTLWTCNEVVYP